MTRSEAAWIAWIQDRFASVGAWAPWAERWTDAVALPPTPDVPYVSTDAGVAGVHFPWPTTRPREAGGRILAAALSDLAAVGAQPWAWWLAARWRTAIPVEFLEAFLTGMADAAVRWRAPLAGGNLTRGELSATFTVVGLAPDRGRRRVGPVAPGDLLWLSGTHGDAALALALDVEDPELPEPLVTAYWRPRPRLTLGRLLWNRPWVVGVADVSDGWLKDLAGLVLPSGLGLELDPTAVPRSATWTRLVAAEPERRRTSYWGGDDYELAFATRGVAPERVRAELSAAGVPVAPVGRVVAERGIHWQRPPAVDPPPSFGYDPYL